MIPVWAIPLITAAAEVAIEYIQKRLNEQPSSEAKPIAEPQFFIVLPPSGRVSLVETNTYSAFQNIPPHWYVEPLRAEWVKGYRG